MKTANEIQELITVGSEKIDAILAVAQEESRELTDEEQADVDAFHGTGDDDGEFGRLQTQLKQAQKIEARQKEIAKARLAPRIDNVPDNNGHQKVVIPAVAKRFGKLKAFEEPEEAYTAGQFLRAVFGRNEDAKEWCEKRGISLAMSETDSSKGGFLVPEGMEASIIRLVEGRGVFRQYARNYPMTSDTDNLPRRESGITVYWVGENTEITASDAELGNVELVARKMGALTKVSSELSEDSIVSIADFITTEIAYGFADKEDEAGFNGDGTSTYGGVTGLNSALQAGSIQDAASGNTTFATLDLADFEGAVGKLPMFAGIMPMWFIHKTGWSLSMSRLATAAGGNTTETIAGGARETLFLGYPVVFCQVLPSTDAVSTIQAYFGDLNMAATLGIRRGVTVSADGGGEYFKNDQVAIKGTQRVAINVHERGDASNAGAMIGLKTAAS